jgi:hypothetical protein
MSDILILIEQFVKALPLDIRDEVRQDAFLFCLEDGEE